MTLTTDKVLALAMDASTINNLWVKSSDDSEGMRLGYTMQHHYFAALIQQQMIKDGWRSPEQVKELAESSSCYDWLLHSANKQEIDETLLSGEAWHKIDADIRRRSKE